MEVVWIRDSGVEEKWIQLGFVLVVGVVRFVNGLDGVEDDKGKVRIEIVFQVFGWSIWVNGYVFY